MQLKELIQDVHPLEASSLETNPTISNINIIPNTTILFSKYIPSHKLTYILINILKT